MKRFFRIAFEIISWAGMSFAAAALIYAVIALICGQHAMPIAKLLQLMAVCLSGSALQYICFTPNVIKSMRYGLRMCLFVIPFLLLLTGFALAFHWFPSTDGRSWLLFVGIFLLCFVLIFAAFEIGFRLTGRRYDGLLGEYKKRREEGE